MSAENNNSAMTTNQNHPDDHLLMFQDEAYALGRAQGAWTCSVSTCTWSASAGSANARSGQGRAPPASSTTSARSCARSMKPLATWPKWIDVVILALDGAWRTGATPAQIIDALVAKQTKNEARTWPDWRTAPADKAIEHVRADEPVDDNTYFVMRNAGKRCS